MTDVADDFNDRFENHKVEAAHRLICFYFSIFHLLTIYIWNIKNNYYEGIRLISIFLFHKNKFQKKIVIFLKH